VCDCCMTRIWILAERRFYGLATVRAYLSEEQAKTKAAEYGTDEEWNPRAIVYAIELEKNNS
jgi:hypothetical protein